MYIFFMESVIFQSRLFLIGFYGFGMTISNDLIGT
jgi:hypothetical protein